MPFPGNLDAVVTPVRCHPDRRGYLRIKMSQMETNHLFDAILTGDGRECTLRLSVSFSELGNKQQLCL